jgi:prepilin-type N-terminal cleavage/methylation domain-containing protein
MRNRDGFTLLEVLIAIVLFVLGVIFLAGSFSNAFVSSIDPEKTGIAMTLAEKRIEEIRNLNFDSGIIDEAKADVPGFTGFQRSVAVATVQTDLKQVTVNVYWAYKDGEITTSLVTYISKN